VAWAVLIAKVTLAVEVCACASAVRSKTASSDTAEKVRIISLMKLDIIDVGSITEPG
jgi:hypothetical protein